MSAPTLPHIDALPALRISARDFHELPERWKRLEGDFAPRFKAAGGKPRWVIGEYVDAKTKPNMLRIAWYRPIVIAPRQQP